jgi:formylglycine-generating enzyme required for sulfatase activity
MNPKEVAPVLRAALAVSAVCVTGCFTTQPLQEAGNTLGMEFVFIPSGMFMMGCGETDTECLSDEKPQHLVSVSQSFYLGKYEVTQAQWTAVMGNNPSASKGDQRPVENVSWLDVQEFIRRLNAAEGTDKYRLPTEAEWEYAARGGMDTKFPFDPSASKEHAWYWNNAGNATHPVGEKKPNPFGLHDMQGNVWEWVQDYYGEGYYVSSLSGALKTPSGMLKGPIIDPPGPGEGANRVLRGGSWSNDLRYLRAAHRNAYAPEYKSGNVGFRLAIAPDKQFIKRAKSLKEEAEKNVEQALDSVNKQVDSAKKGIESNMPSKLPDAKKATDLFPGGMKP